jgi:hypothetical protein
MANSKNSLTDVGAASGQFKNKFSILEQTQLNALNGIGSLNSSGSGNISSALTNLSNNSKSKLEVGFNVAEQLEAAGITNITSSQFISKNISKSVTDRSPIHKTLNQNSNRRIAVSRDERPQDKIKRKKESLLGKEDYNYAGLRFPADIDAESPLYLQLLFSEYIRSDPQAPGSLSPNTPIYLPAPDNLAQEFSVIYDQRDTGIMGEFIKSQTGGQLVGAARTFLSGGGTENFTSTLKSAVQDNEQVSEALKSIGQRGIYAGINSSNEELGGLASQISGEIPNPHPTVFFKGMNLRAFQFNWRLIPRSPEEAAALYLIIREIKKKSLPEKTGTILKYPHFVDIKFLGSAAPVIGNYKRCLISAVNINYSGEGTSAFFKDGMPVSTLLNITFQEVENFTSQDVI